MKYLAVGGQQCNILCNHLQPHVVFYINTVFLNKYTWTWHGRIVRFLLNNSLLLLLYYYYSVVKKNWLFNKNFF